MKRAGNHDWTTNERDAFGVGPFNAYQGTLNIQPVIPISVTKESNIITRTILSVESWPAIRSDAYMAGIGDTTFTAFTSPAPQGTRDPLFCGLKTMDGMTKRWQAPHLPSIFG